MGVDSGQAGAAGGRGRAGRGLDQMGSSRNGMRQKGPKLDPEPAGPDLGSRAK